MLIAELTKLKTQATELLKVVFTATRLAKQVPEVHHPQEDQIHLPATSQVMVVEAIEQSTAMKELFVIMVSYLVLVIQSY